MEKSDQATEPSNQANSKEPNQTKPSNQPKQANSKQPNQTKPNQTKQPTEPSKQ